MSPRYPNGSRRCWGHSDLLDGLLDELPGEMLKGEPSCRESPVYPRRLALQLGLVTLVGPRRAIGAVRRVRTVRPCRPLPLVRPSIGTTLDLTSTAALAPGRLPARAAVVLLS